MEQLEYLRRNLQQLTVAEGIDLMKGLGSFHYDKMVLRWQGVFTEMRVLELPLYRNDAMLARLVHPIQFSGGPFHKKYIGTFLTMVLDRAMLVMCQEGKDVLDAVMKAVEVSCTR